MLAHMTAQSRKQLVESLRSDVRRLQDKPSARAEVAALKAAIAALEGGVVPNTGRASTPAAPSPASLKRPVPRAGASGDPRLAKMDALVRNVLGEHRKLGTKNVGAWQFAGVDESFDPYESQNK
jgi:hypothetical protein